MHFFDEVSSQNVTHIDDLSFLGNAQITLGILLSCVICQPFYLTRIIPPSFFLFLFASFDRIIMQACGDIMGLGSWESF